MRLHTLVVRKDPCIVQPCQAIQHIQNLQLIYKSIGDEKVRITLKCETEINRRSYLCNMDNGSLKLTGIGILDKSFPIQFLMIDHKLRG